MASYREKLPVVSSGGAVIKYVKQEITTIPADKTSKVYSLAYSVDPARSFITGVCIQSEENYSGVGDDISLVRISITGPNSITLIRNTAYPALTTISFQVVEFLSGVSVQRGVSIVSAPTLSVPISTIDPTKSFISLSMTVPVNVATYGANMPTMLLYESSLKFMRPKSGGITYTIAWEVISYV